MLRAIALLAIVTCSAISAATRVESLVVTDQYARGWLWQCLFGRNWRALWSTPAEIPVFDLGAIGGGLRAKRTVGSFQTQGLVLASPDGRSYTFRGLEKANFVPDWLDWSPATEVLRDQSSGNLPAADLVAARLGRSVGVPMTERLLGVLPDDSRLGEFRSDFAGLVGTISEFPLAGDDAPGTFGAVAIIESEELWERARRGEQASVDARSYLRARLLDWWVADFDRHPEQWRWARLAGHSDWQAISEDHDHAFPRYDGLLTALARLRNPWLLRFDDAYSLRGLTNNSRSLDAWLLAGLDQEAWEEEVASFLELARAGAIEEALTGFPASWRGLAGEEIEKILHVRLEKLSGFAMDAYRSLAEVIPLHGSDGDDRVELACRADGTLALEFQRGREAEWIRRTLHPRDTRRVEVFWYAGSDRISRGGSRICGLEVVEHTEIEVELERGVPVAPETGPHPHSRTAHRAGDRSGGTLY
jgi:hypothetical protein